MVWAFGLVVAAATAKVIWGDEIFPPEKDPKGDPKTWTREEMRRWLAARNLFPQDTDTKEELLERVLANMRRTNPPPSRNYASLPAPPAAPDSTTSHGYHSHSPRRHTYDPIHTMAFLEDPRLRQRWNQITHDAEAVTENAAAGIWTFQHNYIHPCFSSFVDSIEQCTTVCLGDPEERLRKRRERDRTTQVRAEYSFDFYDDWYEEEEAGGLFSSWGNDDWDRLLAGKGSQRKHSGGETSEQPTRKRGMSYGTRGGRRKATEEDPTIIPSTQPIGFLSKLPWKMGGTLRYKPSAADLQDHPGRHGEGEVEPLLGSDDESDYGNLLVTRKRSGTTGSGDTSDSYRSRGDLFPSDGEGEEDAIPLDDEVTYDMVRKDDRSSRRTRSKGKRPASGFSVSRTVSRTTLGSVRSRDSLRIPSRDSLRVGHRSTSTSLPATPDVEDVPSFYDLQREEHMLQQAEDEQVARKKAAAAQLAAEKGLDSTSPALRPVPEPKPIVAEDEVYEPLPSKDVPTETTEVADKPHVPHESAEPNPPSVNLGPGGDTKQRPEETAFIPARLPNFG
ncbi:hypothetical protein G7Z17_g4210 [Cylindrodendrum hubeiense]|uniref:Uncharacterized protein n=1 Tax=Cylindrodendrum hubeiense TaxID=595255 RepID=A0A9P5HHB4_9HYPO|nr:hypothetical protein G7Z17_g4210 [Cylindrodendrum hubeiense]